MFVYLMKYFDMILLDKYIFTMFLKKDDRVTNRFREVISANDAL